MANSDALIGSGMPAAQAQQLGGPVTTLTCKGTNQGGAALITSKCTILNAQSSQTGAILPSGSADGVTGLFAPYWLTVGTIAATSAVLYAPSSGYLNGTLNGSSTIAVNHAFCAVQVASGIWYTIPQAP